MTKPNTPVDKWGLFKEIGYEPHPSQVLYHESEARFRVPICGRRFGKAEALTNKVPLASGDFEYMGNLQPGDSVLGPDGLPTKVVAVSKVMHDQPCYRVVFNDNTGVVVAGDHLWMTWDKGARKTIGRSRHETEARCMCSYPQVRTTEQVRSTLLTGSGENNHAIELTAAVQYPEQLLPVDPYVLGVWLGDGNANCAELTAHDDDLDVLLEIERAGYTVEKLSSKYRWIVRGLMTELRLLGVLMNKHAPDEYLFGSVGQRLALLQGLMDTDGTVTPTGNCCFDNTNKALADAVYHLLVSLGAKATRYVKQGKLSGANNKLVYRVNFSAPSFPVFRLGRKLVRQQSRRSSTGQFFRMIKAVELVESVPVKCIQVDREDGLYLTSEHYLITHNSMMAARDEEPYYFIPNTTNWVVGPTYTLGEKEFRIIWDDLLVKMGLMKMKGLKKAYNVRTGEMYIHFPWNTRVEVKSATRPDLLVGEALDRVVMSEAAKHTEQTWQQFIRPSLSDRRGAATFPTTPEGYNWLYRLWRLGQPGVLEAENALSVLHSGGGSEPALLGSESIDITEWASWQFPSWYNTVVFPGGFDDPEIVQSRLTMTPEVFAQEYGAGFSAIKGRIFGEFNREVHVVKGAYKFQMDWPNYIAFDWGFTAPLAAIEFQVSPTGTVYIWREHYKSGLTVGDHLNLMRGRQQPEGYHINCCFGDAADPEAVLVVNQSFGPCIALPEAKTNWREGISLVKKFLKEYDTGLLGPDEAPIMRPKLFVTPTCENTIREFETYRSPDKGNEDNEARAKGSVSTSSADHAMDAIRYGFMHVFKFGAGGTGLSISDIYAIDPDDKPISYRDPAQLESLLANTLDYARNRRYPVEIGASARDLHPVGSSGAGSGSRALSRYDSTFFHVDEDLEDPFGLDGTGVGASGAGGVFTGLSDVRNQRF